MLKIDKQFLKKELERIEELRFRKQLTITNEKTIVDEVKKSGVTKGTYKLALVSKDGHKAVIRIKRINASKEDKSRINVKGKKTTKRINVDKKEDKPYKRVYQGFKLPPKLIAKLTSYATKTEQTKTSVVEKSLKAYLKKDEG